VIRDILDGVDFDPDLTAAPADSLTRGPIS